VPQVVGAVLAIFFYDQHSKVLELAGRFPVGGELDAAVGHDLFKPSIRSATLRRAQAIAQGDGLGRSFSSRGCEQRGNHRVCGRRWSGCRWGLGVACGAGEGDVAADRRVGIVRGSLQAEAALLRHRQPRSGTWKPCSNRRRTRAWCPASSLGIESGGGAGTRTAMAPSPEFLHTLLACYSCYNSGLTGSGQQRETPL
jgi:hypothetical protein